MTLRYAFYGDDFTGSTDVLEQLAEGGLEAVLFLRTPDAGLLDRFPNVEAIGIAGDSRSRPPAWMDDKLPVTFGAFRHADIVHYKTCSTFDSSPHIGSIGRALDLGLDAFGSPAAIVVAAPQIGRYVAFGNLFAKVGRDVYRIDRHPTMSCHPVTPMHEADLIRHLGAQTRKVISLVSLDRIQAGEGLAAFDAAARGSDAVLFDGITLRDLAETGKVLTSRGVRFVAGSSGVTRALVLALREQGLIDKVIAAAPVDEVRRLLVVSGSCSPVTARQIARAAEQGFATRPIDVAAILRGDSAEEQRCTQSVLAVLRAGRSCVIHSADGPLDSSDTPAGDRLGEALGRIARTLIREAGLRRVLFAGGDTSSHAVARLGVDALTWAAPLEAGAPLVRSHSQDASVDGLQMVLKGGQIGSESFFELVRRGALPVEQSA